MGVIRKVRRSCTTPGLEVSINLFQWLWHQYNIHVIACPCPCCHSRFPLFPSSLVKKNSFLCSHFKLCPIQMFCLGLTFLSIHSRWTCSHHSVMSLQLGEKVILWSNRLRLWRCLWFPYLTTRILCHMARSRTKHEPNISSQRKGWWRLKKLLYHARRIRGPTISIGE
jgi:hypothetical protein